MTTTDEPSHPWLTSEIEELSETVASLRSVDEAERFLRDLCTIGELEAMAHRWQGSIRMTTFRRRDLIILRSQI